MTPNVRRRLALAMVASAVLLCLWLVKGSDVWSRWALVGRWSCGQFYSSSATLMFLGGGSYAQVTKKADGSRSSEFGSWDIAHGELLLIVDHGNHVKDSTTWSRISVSVTGGEFSLINSNGSVGARCERITGDPGS